MQAQDKSLLFAHWVEGELNAEQKVTFQRLCLNDAEFAKRVATYERMQTLEQQYQDYDVPQWDREATMDVALTTEKPPRAWWKGAGISWLSLAASVTAICMVSLNVQVQLKDDGVLIGLANRYTEAQIAELVETKVQDINQENLQQLALYQQQLQQQQQQFSTQLADYILSSNRTERKEDFAELIKYVNQQRNDDQIYYARQLNLLEANLSQGAFKE
ncbi:hypothetical protein [Alteromonas sp. a30]|uniref:hypothetical protein n=1 Tax=Alteromonas sp. a30 TaxID=2730917 RepID=UPI00227EB720|nr:hypothetical protein [Alteromonas sp. a30]MCY7296022.1 hypothetical protein [Alteromonas sp. a30]